MKRKCNSVLLGPVEQAWVETRRREAGMSKSDFIATMIAKQAWIDELCGKYKPQDETETETKEEASNE
jgi:hypothetical protein